MTNFVDGKNKFLIALASMVDTAQPSQKRLMAEGLYDMQHADGTTWKDLNKVPFVADFFETAEDCVLTERIDIVLRKEQDNA